MPSTLSSKKRLRQNIARRGRNRAAKSAARTSIRNVREAIAAGDVEKSEASFHVAAQLLDKTAASSVLHPNKVARIKSRLSKAIKKLKDA